MIGRVLLACMVAAALDAGVCAASESEDAWLRVRGRYVTLYTQGRRAEAIRQVERMDEFQRVLEQEGWVVLEPMRIPTTLVARREAGDLGGVIRSTDGKNPLFTSATAATDFGTWILFLDREVQHELGPRDQLLQAGLLAFADGVPWSIGFGLSAYYSTARTRAGGVELGTPPEGFEAAASLEDFSRLEADLGISGSFATEAVFGQWPGPGVRAWVLMHYLMNRPGGREACREFVRAVGAGQPLREAYEARYSPARWVDLVPELQRYVRQPFPSRTAPELPDLPPVEYRVREAQGAEAEAHMNFVRVVHGSVQGTFADRARDAARWETTGGLSHALHATFERSEGRTGSARETYRSIGQLTSPDPLALSIAGTGLLTTPVGDGEAGVEQAHEMLARSVELDPANALAAGWLAAASIMLGRDDERALASLEQAARARPIEFNFAFDRVMLLLKLNRRDEARVAVRALPDDREHAGQAAAAHAAIDVADVADSVQSAMSSRDVARAKAVLARAEARMTDSLSLALVRGFAARADSADRMLRSKAAFEAGGRYALEDRWSEAREQFERARALNLVPELRPRLEAAVRMASHMSEYEKALALLRKGQYEQAARAFERARDLAPDAESRERSATRAREARALVR